MIKISKSRYTSFVTCPKQFWLTCHKPELAEETDASLEMGGSFSIKAVLPALCPNNPDLDYKANEDVQHGMAATQAFLSLKYRTAVERERIRKNLLKYCGLDTWAMVVVYRELGLHVACNPF
jgi:hypothetical protein